MRELAVLTFQTLDGVMQAPYDREEDTSRGFSSAGWALGCWDDVMAQVAVEAMSVPYDLLLGRRTYEIFARSHGATDDDDPNPMTLATKYVVTSNPDTLTWANSKPISGDVAAEVAELKRQDGPLLQVHGSWQLVQTLVAHGLVDEFRLWTFPVIAGEGKRVFEQSETFRNLTLRKSGVGDTGATMAIYRAAK